MDGKDSVIYKQRLLIHCSQYGILEQGIVYPGDVEVVVELTNGSNICPDVTFADNNCSVTLPRDVYNISISQSNGIGSTVYITMFDSEFNSVLCIQ